MAAASGQPQDPKAKKEVTAEQRKLYGALGVIGVLALIAGVMYVPGMLHGSSTSTDSTPPAGAANAVTGSVPSPAGANLSVPPSGSGEPGGPGAAAPDSATGGVTLTSSVTPGIPHAGPASKWSLDPFQQPMLYPTPKPTPPPPVDIPTPGIATPVFLPGTNMKISDLPKSMNLPQITLGRSDIVQNRPTDAFPPRRSAGPGAGAEVVTPSFDKRLSGVIIGDGVRALLEITTANGITTRVVQPGDEVDGITILNIQRFNDGTKTVTRMLIRENGEERSVELRAGVQQQTQGGEGGLGSPGSSGAPGGFGGRPGGGGFQGGGGFGGG